MSVVETVADIVALIRAANQPVQGGWVKDDGGFIAWMDADWDDRIFISRRYTLGVHTTGEWAGHPAVLPVEDVGDFSLGPEIALAPWALEDGMLAAMLSAGVDADYAHVAHHAGVTDAGVIIDCWTSGIPVEYLAEVAP